VAEVRVDFVDFLAKDPHWTWIGWSLSAASREQAARAAGLDPQTAQLTLRVFDLSDPDGREGPACIEVQVLGETDHWYLRLPGSGRIYGASAGFKSPAGSFHSIAASQPLELPSEAPAARCAEEGGQMARGRQAGGDERGYLLIVLNSHMPFIRDPEDQHSLEERWLFEAMIESYIPLLRAFAGLRADGVDSRITLSVSPPLLAMLADPLLMRRFLLYAEDHARLAAAEESRLGRDVARCRLARLYRERFEDSRLRMERDWGCNLIGPLRELEEAGQVELITSAATHAYLPLWQAYPMAIELQVRIGIAQHAAIFGRRPLGFWLPECGFSPGIDTVLAASGVRFSFLAAHGLLNGKPRPTFGVHAPVLCPGGVAAFGRDWHSHDLAWRMEVGYPGDPAFLDHDRDLGYEMPASALAAFTHHDVAVPTGLRYWRGRRPDRTAVYDPDLALARCEAHAAHFVEASCRRVEELHQTLGRKPVLVALFDTEHFGHWWHEGPQWLGLVIRKLAHEQQTVRLVTATDYLALQPSLQAVRPSMSSWGYQGYSEPWLMGRNHWIYPPLFRAIEALPELARHAGEGATPARALLHQYLRELLLAQSSDWAFILHTETAAAYAERRVKESIAKLQALAQALTVQSDALPSLTAARRQHDIFASLDLFAIYSEIEHRNSGDAGA
jgi:1,4-alpha-glucan branching enzyme